MDAGQKDWLNKFSIFRFTSLFQLGRGTCLLDWSILSYGASLVAQRVKHLPVMWETQVQSLGREDPLKKEWQPTPVFLLGESQGQRSLVGYSPQGHKESDTTERLHTHTHTHSYACVQCHFFYMVYHELSISITSSWRPSLVPSIFAKLLYHNFLISCVYLLLITSWF